MNLVVDGLSWLFLMTGCTFSIIGGIGLLRMPDFYSRVHAGGVTDTMGAWLILAGLMLQAGPSLNLARLVIILAFMAITSPTGTHLLMRAAWNAGLAPQLAPGGNLSLEEQPVLTPGLDADPRMDA